MMSIMREVAPLPLSQRLFAIPPSSERRSGVRESYHALVIPRAHGYRQAVRGGFDYTVGTVGCETGPHISRKAIPVQLGQESDPVHDHHRNILGINPFRLGIQAIRNGQR